MDRENEIIRLLGEIRNVQREHLAAYREFTGKIAAGADLDRANAEQSRQTVIEDQRAAHRRNTWIVASAMAAFIGVVVLFAVVILFAVLDGLQNLKVL